MTRPKLRQNLTACFWIILTGTLAYSNHFNNPFQFDTVSFLPENRLFLEPEKILTWDYLQSQYFSRGLLFMSFALNAWVHGMEPFGFHVTNLVLHLINGMLAYFVVARSIKFFNPDTDQSSRHWIASFSALAFVCHPLQTESVSYVISRSEVLAGIFYLGSFLLIQKLWDRNHPVSVANQWWMLPMVLLIGLGLGFSVKQTLITLPMMVLLYYLFGFESTSPLKAFIIRRRVWVAAGVLIFLSALFYKLFSDEQFLIGPSSAGEVIGRKNYMLSQVWVIVFYYLKLIAFPFNLNVDPDIPMIASLVSVEFWIAMGILLGIAYLFIFKIRSPLYRFWACWFFIVLSPSSSIVTLNDLAAEHRVYLALLGALVILGSSFHNVLNTMFMNPKFVHSFKVGLLCLLILAFCAGTFKRNQVWANELNLWHDAEKKSPHKFRPLVNLGRAYTLAGNVPKALEYYERALAINRNLFELNYNVGVLYQEAGRLDEALKRFQLAAALKPHIPDVHGRLGQLYLAKKNLERARVHLVRAVELNPKYSEGFRNLGVIHYYHLKDPAQGIAFFKRSLFLNPNQQGAEKIRNLIEQAQRP